ncbi:MAG: phage major capsid protein [Actinomycetota bacterium]|nr:phage major capsid protein [Actinomycetota bacterium]
MPPKNSPTAERLIDQRAQYLNSVDVIIDTMKAKNQTRPSKEDEDKLTVLNASIDALNKVLDDGFDTVERTFHAPNINVRGKYSVGADHEPDRRLDALLWASNDYAVTPTGARNPIERVVVRSDSGDPGFEAPRLTTYNAEHRETVREFQNLVADMALFGLLADKDAKSSKQGFEVARNHRAYAGQWRQIMNALDVDTSGEGGTWVPTGIGASMHEQVRVMGKVAPLFQRITLPSNPWKLPIEGADATAYRVAEPTTDTETAMTASTPGTLAATFDAEIFGARTIFSRSVDADSAVAMVPFVRSKLVRAFSKAEESCILDGDTDGTHMDADVQAIGATDTRTAWDGLRKKGLAQTATALTATTAANLLAARKAMLKWGANPTDLAFIIGVSSLHALMADTALLTVDKMGPNAVILNGQIGSIYGTPVVVSEHIREDLNGSGVYDGLTTTKTWFCCVHRGEWVIGERMALDVEIDDSIRRETYQRTAIAFSRTDMQHIGSAATNDDTSVGYNCATGS